MSVGYKHTWGLATLVVVTLLSLRADARGRPQGEVLISGPGGEAMQKTHKSQVQVWACHSGKMNTCSIHAQSGALMTPGGPIGRDGKVAALHLDYRKVMKEAAAKRRQQSSH